jgi:tetratricopeptide (TPR) repeat protein
MNHPNIALLYNNIGFLHEKMWKLDEALEYHDKSYRIRKHLYKDERHQSVLTSKSNTARVKLLKGNCVEAEDIATEVLNARKEKFGAYDKRVVLSYLLYARVIREKKEYDKAIESLHCALEISINKDGENSVNTNDCYKELAITYLARYANNEDLLLAEKYIEKALAFYRTEYGDSNSNTIAVLHSRGKIRRCKQNEVDASHDFRETYRAYLRLFGDSAPPTIDVINDLRAIYHLRQRSVSFEQWINEEEMEIIRS